MSSAENLLNEKQSRLTLALNAIKSLAWLLFIPLAFIAFLAFTSLKSDSVDSNENKTAPSASVDRAIIASLQKQIDELKAHSHSTDVDHTHPQYEFECPFDDTLTFEICMRVSAKGVYDYYDKRK